MQSDLRSTTSPSEHPIIGMKFSFHFFRQLLLILCLFLCLVNYQSIHRDWSLYLYLVIGCHSSNLLWYMNIHKFLGEWPDPPVCPLEHLVGLYLAEVEEEGSQGAAWVLQHHGRLPLSIKQPHDPHERDYQHIHFVPWFNSLALQGEAQGHPRTTTTTITITITITTTITTTATTTTKL
ncbi:hypothetical protein E2C01_032428 [Portunus trituberculatus]|uniref:Uncharacterized protein n=1 Tax=Portunus trituberculatus TaxID=210409 RepID=A0A5B7EVZ5_PORTR|nr:hypothetical protein [Portunus trituberculatus]